MSDARCAYGIKINSSNVPWSVYDCLRGADDWWLNLHDFETPPKEARSSRMADIREFHDETNKWMDRKREYLKDNPLPFFVWTTGMGEGKDVELILSVPESNMFVDDPLELKPYTLQRFPKKHKESIERFVQVIKEQNIHHDPKPRWYVFSLYHVPNSY